jgi:DNA polymerase III sliding clamp (beta) subunit (PCNA family)
MLFDTARAQIRQKYTERYAIEEIVVQLNTPLSATVFAPCSDEDYIYLVMPVQLRN